MTIQNNQLQLEEEQYSDDFETIEKPKETNLIIEEKTKQMIEQSSILPPINNTQ